MDKDKRWQGTTHPLDDLKNTRELKHHHKREERMGRVARKQMRTHEETEITEAPFDAESQAHDRHYEKQTERVKNMLDKYAIRGMSYKQAVKKISSPTHILHKEITPLHEETELDEALNIQQRQKRAIIMRRYKSKIERAREIAQKRVASESNIKKRAYAQARQIFRRKLAGDRGAEYEKLGPSEKMAIDKMLDNKGKAIKKLAGRLIPKVKRAEYERLKSFMKGQALVNHGAAEGKISEEFNDLFLEYFGASAPGNSGSTGERSINPIAADKTKGKSNGKSKNSQIQILGKFEEEAEMNSSIFKALEKKADKSGIDLDILGEVYDRGLAAWSESYKVSPTQYAFARVNSYINQGKTYFNEDADLHEGMIHSVHVSAYDSKGQKALNSNEFANHVKAHGGEVHYGSDKGVAFKFKSAHQAANFHNGIMSRFRDLSSENDGEMHEEARDPDANTKARRKVQNVERDTTPETPGSDAARPTDPCSDNSKQQRIRKVVMGEEGNVQPDPKKRLIGTDSLVKAYKKDTPGESLDESFQMAFDYQGKPTLAPTAAELHMKAKGGFAHHTDVQNVMEVTEIKNKIQAAFETTILEEDKDQLALSYNELTEMVQEAYGIIAKIKSSTVERDAWSEAQILKMERYIQSVNAYLDNMYEDVVAADRKGELVAGHKSVKTDPKTGEQIVVNIPSHVRKAPTGKKIIKSGSPNDGIPG